MFNSRIKKSITGFNCNSFYIFDTSKFLRGADITQHDILLTTAERRRLIYYLYSSVIGRMCIERNDESVVHNSESDDHAVIVEPVTCIDESFHYAKKTITPK